jgi:hypothetical protein
MAVSVAFNPAGKGPIGLQDVERGQRTANPTRRKASAVKGTMATGGKTAGKAKGHSRKSR